MPRTMKTMLAERLLLGLCVCFLETTHSVCRVQRWDYLHENAGSFCLKPKTRGAFVGPWVFYSWETLSLCAGFKHRTTCRGNMCFLETTHSVCRVERPHEFFFVFLKTQTLLTGSFVRSWVLYSWKTLTVSAGFKHGTACRGNMSAAIRLENRVLCQSLSPSLSLSLSFFLSL